MISNKIKKRVKKVIYRGAQQIILFTVVAVATVMLFVFLGKLFVGSDNNSKIDNVPKQEIVSKTLIVITVTGQNISYNSKPIEFSELKKLLEKEDISTIQISMIDNQANVQTWAAVNAAVNSLRKSP